MYRKFFKRFFDVLLSGCALILLSPVLLIVAVLVRTKLGSPVIFCQERPGKNEKIFKMYKFRSMTDARDENGVLLPDEVRLTRLGRILRSTSLDELPELWNILRGDMSIVGPRPLLVKYLPLYNEEQRHRRDQRPSPKDQCTALVRVMSHGQAETGQQDEHPADALLPQMAGHPGIPWQLHPKKEDHIPQAVVAHHADEVEASQLIQQGVTVCRYF